LIQQKMVGRVETGEKPELLWEHPELEQPNGSAPMLSTRALILRHLSGRLRAESAT
jgi:hypothetical protein